MSLKSRLELGLTSPRRALVYLLCGKEAYFAVTEHTCAEAKPEDSPLFPYVAKSTDIHEHLTTLYMLTVQMNLKKVLELGTYRGYSTIALLQAAKEINGRLTSIDLAEKEVIRQEIEKCKQEVKRRKLDPYWNFIRADDLKIKWDSQIDHLFIDTDHTYLQTLRELKKYEPHVRKGGIITMHDSVSAPPVKKAVKEYFKGRKDIRIHEYLNCNGLFVIFKK